MRRAFASLAVPMLAIAGAFAGCLPESDTTSAADGGQGVDGAIVILSEDSGGSPASDGGDGGLDATLRDAGGSDASANDTGAGDTGPSDASLDAMDATDAADAALPPLDAGTANVRLVNLVPDLGQAIDVCAAPHGTPLQGPFLKEGGVTAGLAYGQMTAYVSVPLVSYADLRVVAANAADCSTPLVPDFDNLPITVAQLATVALMGSAGDAGGHTPSLAAFADDPATGFPSEGARIRFVNAAPAAPSTDIVLGAGAYFEAQQVAVPYGAASSVATTATGGFAPDSNGYVTETMYTAQFNARHAGADVASFTARSSAPNGIASSGISAFLTGLPGSTTTPPAWVLCDDTKAAAGYLATCETVSAGPSKSPFRLNHLSIALPAVDMCMHIQDGTPTTTFGPFLQGAGLDGGVSFAQITGDLGPIPTDTDITVTYVPAGAGCGATPLAIVGNVYLFGQPGVVDQAIALAPANLTYASDTVYLDYTPAAGEAAVYFAFFDFANQSSTSPYYDVDDALEGGAGTLLASTYALGSFEENLAPGSHTLTVTAIDGGATTYSESGMAFAAGDVWVASYVDTNRDGGTTLVRCNLAQRDAGVVTACAE